MNWDNGNEPVILNESNDDDREMRHTLAAWGLAFLMGLALACLVAVTR